MGAQLTGLDSAECKKQHKKNKYRLYIFYALQYKGMSRRKTWDIYIKEITRNTTHNGNGQCPVLQEKDYTHIASFGKTNNLLPNPSLSSFFSEGGTDCLKAVIGHDNS